MKGSLHTDELMGAVVSRQSGIRTARRISHCFIMDVPGHPDALIITDAAVNIAPTSRPKSILSRTRSIWPMRWAWRMCGSRFSQRDGDGHGQGALDDRGGGALQDGGSRPDHRRDCSTVRSRSTTPSAWRRRRLRRLFRQSPAAPTCWWFPTSRPATCSRRVSRFSLAQTPRASCLARACRSS